MASENINYLTTSQGSTNFGMAFPVVAGTGGFFTRTNGLETVLSGFKQLLLTNPGERVMNPKFGMGMRKYVFEPATPQLEEKIKKSIIEAITHYAPDVLLKQLVVSVGKSQYTTNDGNSILISLKVAFKDDLLHDRELDIII
tara:strand:+ start:118 stop:543 length:426 start_codon:yes stop_codon:yes gene_type:complete